jgi:hypothetical protein
LRKHKIALIEVSLAVSVFIQGAASASGPLPQIGKTKEEERWQLVKKNIREFMNLSEQEFLNILGPPDYALNGVFRLLQYRLDDRTEITFYPYGDRIHLYSFRRSPMWEAHSGPHIQELPPLELDKNTYEKRWRIIQGNLRDFMDMPYENLVKLLGPLDSQYCEDRYLIYGLGNKCDVHFDCINLVGDRVGNFSFDRHSNQYFVLPSGLK